MLGAVLSTTFNWNSVERELITGLSFIMLIKSKICEKVSFDANGLNLQAEIKQKLIFYPNQPKSRLISFLNLLNSFPQQHELENHI